MRAKGNHLHNNSANFFLPTDMTTNSRSRRLDPVLYFCVNFIPEGIFSVYGACLRSISATLYALCDRMHRLRPVDQSRGFLGLLFFFSEVVNSMDYATGYPSLLYPALSLLCQVSRLTPVHVFSLPFKPTATNTSRKVSYISPFLEYFSDVYFIC